MNKKPFIFVENANTGVITKHDLPDDFDGNLGNFLVGLSIEHGYGCASKFFIGNLA